MPAAKTASTGQQHMLRMFVQPAAATTDKHAQHATRAAAPPTAAAALAGHRHKQLQALSMFRPAAAAAG